jgi:energy-coupling factor transporter ATP-binding protein EcfA2
MTCLVGKNGYGKTKILDALLAITTPNHSNVEDVYHYRDRRKPVIAEPVNRVILEGQSDRFWLQFAIKGVITEGRPSYEAILVDGIVKPEIIWKRIWRNYLCDRDWVESTKKIVVIFDGDEEGKKARSFIERKCLEKKIEEGANHIVYGLDKFVFSSIEEITEVAGAIGEDLVPWKVVKDFCLNKLATLKNESASYHIFDKPIGASAAFSYLAEINPTGSRAELKREFLEYARSISHQNCFKDSDVFNKRLENHMRSLLA